MPRNGSGGTSQPASSIYPAVASTLIESAKFNISVADIYTMLAASIAKDGQTTTTAAIPFAVGIKTDDVNENKAGEGVTIDGALIKDGRIDTTQGTDIVCAATLNLETATGNVVDVTGSTGPVTAITLSQGHWRLVRFTGTPTLTDGASLVLPGGENITVAAGDYMLFIGYASSVVRVAAYWPVTGPQPFLDSNPVIVGTTDTTKKVRFEVDGLTTGTTRVITVPDANITLANWSTGDAKLSFKSSADAGWIMADDGSIGNASSGATTRANADTEALYTVLWNNITDTYAPVSTGRGASAAADFAANKTLTIPKALGRAIAVAGSGATLTARSLGQTLGTETHTLTTGEMPAHTHPPGTGDRFAYETNAGGNGYSAGPFTYTAAATTGSTGGGGAHANMQPTVFLNVMIKL